LRAQLYGIPPVRAYPVVSYVLPVIPLSDATGVHAMSAYAPITLATNCRSSALHS
jgi:hypothetical protein